MKPIISTRKNNRPARNEGKANSKLLETVGKMRVGISLTHTHTHRGTFVNLSGTRNITDLISTNRAHFALEGHKLYIIPSMDGFWRPRSNGWKATLSNKEMVDALEPYAGAVYPVVLELMDLAGIPDFPMYYIDLNKPISSHKTKTAMHGVDEQLAFA